MLGLHLNDTLKLLDVVDLTICCRLYKVCNGNQFEPMKGTDFVDFLNLKPLSTPVRVRYRENSRVCYLLYSIAKEIKNDTLSKEWLLQVLKHCKISYDYYKSHYKDADSAGTSDMNIQFASAVNEAIEEAKSMM